MIRRDEFEHIIASKLSNEEVPPPADMFNRITSARKKRKKGFVLWRKKYAAAVLLLLSAASVGLMLWNNKSAEKDNTAPAFNQWPIQEENTKSGEQKESSFSETVQESISESNHATGEIGEESDSEDLVNTVLAPDEMKVQGIPDNKKEISNDHLVKENNAPTKVDNDRLPEDKAGDLIISETDESYPIADDKAMIAAEELIDKVIREEEAQEMNKEVLPQKRMLTKWALGIDFGLGWNHSFYSGDQQLAELNESSSAGAQTRSIAFNLSYDVNNNWSLRSGIALIDNFREVNHEWNTTRSYYEVNERNVTVYDPLLPPRELTIRDTLAYVSTTTTHDLNGTHEHRRIFIPLGISRNFYKDKWGLSTTIGAMIQLNEMRSGWMIASPGKSVEASEITAQSPFGSAWLDVGVSRRMGHRTWIITGPRALFDLNATHFSSELEALHQKDLMLQWQLSLKINL